MAAPNKQLFEIINVGAEECGRSKYISCQIARKGSPIGSDCITVAAAPLWMVQVLVSKASLYEEFVANAESEKEEVS